MSLDTVLLVMDMESYFGLTIPDTEAERMYTVQDIADGVCRLLPGQGLETGLSPTFGQVLAALQRELRELQPLPEPSAATPLPELLPPEADVRRLFLQQLALRTGWQMPELPIPAPPTTRWLVRLFEREPLRRPDWRRDTLAELAGWVISLNYQPLYAGHQFRHPYDVLRLVTGIVCERSGVDIWEIRPQDSITNDLGMD